MCLHRSAAGCVLRWENRAHAHQGRLGCVEWCCSQPMCVPCGTVAGPMASPLWPIYGSCHDGRPRLMQRMLRCNCSHRQSSITGTAGGSNPFHSSTYTAIAGTSKPKLQLCVPYKLYRPTEPPHLCTCNCCQEHANINHSVTHICAGSCLEKHLPGMPAIAGTSVSKPLC